MNKRLAYTDDIHLTKFLENESHINHKHIWSSCLIINNEINYNIDVFMKKLQLGGFTFWFWSMCTFIDLMSGSTKKS